MSIIKNWTGTNLIWLLCLFVNPRKIRVAEQFNAANEFWGRVKEQSLLQNIVKIVGAVLNPWERLKGCEGMFYFNPVSVGKCLQKC